jgi:hypothetical protein
MNRQPSGRLSSDITVKIRGEVAIVNRHAINHRRKSMNPKIQNNQCFLTTTTI